MICPKCGGNNVSITVVNQQYEEKRRGCLMWCVWIILAICTIGLILIIPFMTRKKTNMRDKTVAICQNCGYRWNL